MDVFYLIISALVLAQNKVYGEATVSNPRCTIMHRFATVDYDWTSTDAKSAAISRGDYIVESNIITGVKVYKDTVYVTVPRWRDGVPSSLNAVTSSASGELLLRPFPSWSMNKQWDCNAIQYAQSMEIDPNTGYMWILDTGRTNTLNTPSPPENLCSPKLWIVDIETKSIVRIYTFPANVVSSTSNFMNDIVLDYVNGVASFAYISDTSDAKIYVYDYKNNRSWFYRHDSMRPAPGAVSKPVDGIAMSYNFKDVYYSPLGALELYATPTWQLRVSTSNFAKNLSLVGNKVGGSDGMVCGENSLYFGNIYQGAVLKVSPSWNLDTQRVLLSDPESVQWPDTFAFNGTDLWFTANNLSAYMSRRMDFSGNITNVYIWKCDVGEHGYLWNASQRTLPKHYHTPGLFG